MPNIRKSYSQSTTDSSNAKSLLKLCARCTSAMLTLSVVSRLAAGSQLIIDYNQQYAPIGEHSHRSQAHYDSLGIVPVSHFSYNEGRKFSDDNVEQLDSQQQQASHYSVGQQSIAGEHYNPQHIYKRSSALISGPHYPQLLSGAQLSLSRQKPMSRRMMSPPGDDLLASASDDSPTIAVIRQPQVQAQEQQKQISQYSAAAELEALLMRQKQHIQYHDQWLASSNNGASGPATPSTCVKRTLNFCASVLPFNNTTFPNIIGDTNRFDVKRSLPFFGFLAKSSCNKRLDELLCLLLEPPCSASTGDAIPPCKKFCRMALEGCSEYIPATLALSSVFDCRQYPDSSDPNVCVNLAQGDKCGQNEFKCPDKTCIPNHWLCDGVRDCEFAADEANCTEINSHVQQASVCSTEEFKCDGKCVPKAWKCDGERDCLDGSDEEACDDRPKCGLDRFRCADGNGCLPKRWVCDGKAECRDGSDELNCLQRACSDSDFKCANGICIPKIWRCDMQFDCKDKSDEFDCPASYSLMAANASSPSSSASSAIAAADVEISTDELSEVQTPLVTSAPSTIVTTTTTTTPTTTSVNSRSVSELPSQRQELPSSASGSSNSDTDEQLNSDRHDALLAAVAHQQAAVQARRQSSGSSNAGNAYTPPISIQPNSISALFARRLQASQQQQPQQQQQQTSSASAILSATAGNIKQTPLVNDVATNNEQQASLLAAKTFNNQDGNVNKLEQPLTSANLLQLNLRKRFICNNPAARKTRLCSNQFATSIPTSIATQAHSRSQQTNQQQQLQIKG